MGTLYPDKIVNKYGALEHCCHHTFSRGSFKYTGCTKKRNVAICILFLFKKFDFTFFTYGLESEFEPVSTKWQQPWLWYFSWGNFYLATNRISSFWSDTSKLTFSWYCSPTPKYGCEWFKSCLRSYRLQNSLSQTNNLYLQSTVILEYIDN